MKKLTFTVAICGLLFATSCKKEETVTTTTDDGKVTVTTTTTKSNLDLKLGEKAKANLENAEKKLAEAKAKGDKEAERLAQITVDKAKSAWEATKEGVKETSEDIKEGTKKAKEDLKEGYNNTLEKAKVE